MQSSGASTSTSKETSKTAILAVEDVLETVTSSLDDSKAEELVTIDIKDKSALADYMIIASGRSNRHVSAIADHLLRELKNIGAGSAKVEGLQSADWVLIDTGDIIIHLFRPEVREFYALEKMWQVPASEEVN
ncbi:MAG: ribosome silencing factor [Pseudomonadota bacterium]